MQVQILLGAYFGSVLLTFIGSCNKKSNRNKLKEILLKNYKGQYFIQSNSKDLYLVLNLFYLVNYSHEKWISLSCFFCMYFLKFSVVEKTQ